MTTPTILRVAAGRNHSLALLDNGEVWGWGAEGSGRVALPEICSEAPPATAIVVPSARPFTSIAAGYGTGYGLTADHRVYYWGINRAGLAGQANVLGTLQAEALANLPPVAQLAVSEFYGLVRDTHGGVQAWGITRGGPLGARNQGLTPVALPGPARHLAVGQGHALALTDDGALAWGANGAGQLGASHLRDQPHPVAVQLPPGVRLHTAAAGASHNLAIDDDGAIWAWGSNQYGQLGRTEPRYSTVPLRVEFGEPVLDVAAGMFFSVALGQSGRVYTWGWNAKGQLGRSPARHDAQPRAVPGLEGITLVAAGQAHVLASSGQALHAWGDNEANQLGPNGQPNRDPENPGWSPAPVSIPV